MGGPPVGTKSQLFPFLYEGSPNTNLSSLDQISKVQTHLVAQAHQKCVHNQQAFLKYLYFFHNQQAFLSQTFHSICTFHNLFSFEIEIAAVYISAGNYYFDCIFQCRVYNSIILVEGRASGLDRGVDIFNQCS